MTRLYKLLILLTIISLSAISSMAQSGQTTVSGTIADGNGTLYINSPYTVTFYDPGTSGKLPLLNGSTFQRSYSGLATNSSGVLSISLPDNNVIASTSGATGTQWTFSICTAAASYTTIFCIPPVTLTITGASQDISAAVTAVAPLLPTTLSNPFIANGSYSGNNTYSGTGTHRGAETFASLNNILYVGIAVGQYPSLQAAHDILPSSGGTVFVTSTALPFGVGNGPLSITKPIHIIFDCGTFTYSGAVAQAIVITSASGVSIEGCGNANGQPAGGTATGGTKIVITNTATNGIDANVAPGLILQNLTILGPNSGTGKCLILTGNSAHAYDINCRAFGSDGVTINGTRGNGNNVTLDRVTSISNGGWGFNVFGVNGNLTVFSHTSGSNNAFGNYQVATTTNVFIGAHSQTSGTGIGFTFPSGGSNNWGDLYSESGDEATAVAFAAGASNNNIFLSSQTAFTNSGTNNTVIANRLLEAGGAAATPGYSFVGSPSTGFYDVGGGALGFSSVGVAKYLLAGASLRFGSGICAAWSSNADPTAAGNDTSFCRSAAAAVDCGNGFAGDKSCQLNLATVNPVSTTVGALPAAAAGNKGWVKTVSDSTAVAAEGQTCIGGSTNTALAFSNGTVWKCF